jgi:protein required for attachment to host cells
MTKQFPIWVLLSDSTRARILTVAGPEQPLVEQLALIHPASRARESEIYSDRPGRVAQAHVGPHPGHGSRSAMEPGTSAKEVEHQRFARQVAEELQQGSNEHAYARLVVVSSPAFLGLLRKELSPQVSQRISVTLDKDYTHLALNELEERLKEHLI